MEIRLNIDGREVYGRQGQTVLEIAKNNGIEIPTLCNDDRVKMYGSCGVCVVEAEGMPRLLRSCSTMAANGMIIKTNTDRVIKTRQSALELLLSDHTGDCRPPCVLACPAQTDCQGYVGLIANGEYKEAVKLVKDKIPLPGAIGRVCPHPCEDACRRQKVEEPIAIANLKRFIADMDLASDDPYTSPTAEATGKKIAVIGGGPGGLSCAYYLREKGHEAHVYDMMPEMGGMLYYGIPEYRLPKEYLKKEISLIEKTGVKFHNNVRIGKDLTLDWMRQNHDAVVVAVGAWTSAALRCKGEELEGVVGGIDFLRMVVQGDTMLAGKRVAVVGGGNTAMDCSRTAVRMGAEKVYNIYRRTKNEMPAEEIEIIEAEEEGVIFKNLTNPNEVVGENGKVKALRLQIMELGEPDASGRRAPVAVEGKEETIEVDTVIVAIGQKLDAFGLDEIEKTKWSTISADEANFTTSLEGVFAVGDATNKGADIAISAIGDAKKAANVVDRYLFGENISYKAPYVVTSDPTEEAFADRAKAPRAKMPHRKPQERNNNFLEVNYGYSEEAAKKEAERCLECGCHDYFECKLINYANLYEVKPEKYEGDIHNRPLEDDHPFIQRNPDKCILCGLCVRVCEEVVGATALGLVDRGFDAMVKPAMDMPLADTDCISCGQCVNVCPTGALTEKMMTKKQVPVAENRTPTTCSFCSVGCKTVLTHKGQSLVRSLPHAQRADEALLCMKGRFGFGEISRNKRIVTPSAKIAGEFKEVNYKDAFILAAKGVQAVQSVHGKESAAVAISGRYTNEQAAYIASWAKSVLGTDKIFSFGLTNSGLAQVLGEDKSTADFEELTASELIVSIESDINAPHAVVGMRIRKAVNNGAKLMVINNNKTAADEIAYKKYTTGEDLELLLGVLKTVLEKSPAAKNLNGYKETLASLEQVKPSQIAAEIADEYLAAKKAVIVFEQSKLSRKAAALIADIALAAGKAFGARNGVIQLKPDANSQGIADLGIKPICSIEPDQVKALCIFGEDVNLEEAGFTALDFLMVHDMHLTNIAKNADVVFPAESYAETTGTFTSSVGKTGEVNKAVVSPVEVSVFEMIDSLSKVLGKQVVTCALPKDRSEPSLVAVEGGKLIRCKKSGSTNYLYTSLMSYAASNRLHS